MRKNLTKILTLCLAISTLVFAFLWMEEKDRREDVKELAQAAAVDAYERFTEYRSRGEASSYWDGVASFRTFQQAYSSVVQGTNQASNALICDEVYGYLLAGPEESQSHIADIVQTMEVLSEDVEDLSGHARMLELRNALAHKE